MRCAALLVIAVLMGNAANAPTAAHSPDPYPARPVRFIIPAPPAAPAQFRAFIRDDVDKWAKVVKTDGIRVDYLSI